MIYKHKNFQLGIDSRKVFDENGKELRLTGNSYRLLVFLCKNKNANITEIGEYLDHAKDYDEDHIRQYKYKINTIVGEDIVEYKNGIYSLVGGLKEADKVFVSDRNTVLLHPNSVGFWENMKNKIKFSKNPAIIASIMLLLSFFAWPYGYYTLLRWVVSVVAIYYTYYLFVIKKQQNNWFYSLVAIAILFNPIAPIYLGSKLVWNIIDVLVAGVFIGLIIKIKK